MGSFLVVFGDPVAGDSAGWCRNRRSEPASPARSSTPYRDTARTARSCFPRARPHATSRTLPTSGTGSAMRTSWGGSGARSTPGSPNGPRWSRRSGCWRSPDAGGARRSIFVGATSGTTSSICPTPRQARARCRSAGRPGRLSRRCLEIGIRTASCSRATPKDADRMRYGFAGGRSARMRDSAGCGCMTCGTPPPVTRSCPARICPWSAGCSGTGGTRPRRAMRISPTGICRGGGEGREPHRTGHGALSQCRITR